MSNIKRIIVGVGIPRLPSEYQEVEYIKSPTTGTYPSTGPYLNTGYIPTAKTKVAFKYMYDSSSSGDFPIYGVWTNKSGNTIFNGWYQSANGVAFGYGDNNGANSYISAPTNTIATVEQYVSGGVMYNVVNGETKTVSGATFSLGSNAIYIFARNNSSSTIECGGGRIYYFRIYESGVLLRNFIPCYRKSDSVIGMYELITNQFYTNSGSGTFSKGADVNNLLGKQVRPYEWEPDSSRTLLYLPLESNATDYSGNSISTTPSNVTYASLGGVMCANANGSSSKIQLSNTSFLPSDATGGTISFLIYGTSRTVGSTYRKVLEFTSSNANIGVYYNTGNNGIWCTGFNTDGYITDSDATLNSWHLITFTFDSTNCYAYFDGVIKFGGSRISSNPIWGKTPDVTGFYIFCNRGGNTNRWSGGGRELIIEKVKRSAEDVSKYYQWIKNKLGF